MVPELPKFSSYSVTLPQNLPPKLRPDPTRLRPPNMARPPSECALGHLKEVDLPKQISSAKPCVHVAGMVSDYVADGVADPVGDTFLRYGDTLLGSDVDIAHVPDRCRES